MADSCRSNCSIAVFASADLSHRTPGAGTRKPAASSTLTAASVRLVHRSAWARGLRSQYLNLFAMDSTERDCSGSFAELHQIASRYHPETLAHPVPLADDRRSVGPCSRRVCRHGASENGTSGICLVASDRPSIPCQPDLLAQARD